MTRYIQTETDGRVTLVQVGGRRVVMRARQVGRLTVVAETPWHAQRIVEAFVNGDRRGEP